MFFDNHARASGPIDFALRVTQAVNRFWPQDVSPAKLKRQLITIVGGKDTSTGNGFPAVQALLAQKGVEYWSIGVNAGASNSTLLAALASTNGYLHYFPYVQSSFLLSGTTPSDWSLRLCPQGSICGANCNGFCGCVQQSTCTCPTCVQVS